MVGGPIAIYDKLLPNNKPIVISVSCQFGGIHFLDCQKVESGKERGCASCLVLLVLVLVLHVGFLCLLAAHDSARRRLAAVRYTYISACGLS